MGSVSSEEKASVAEGPVKKHEDGKAAVPKSSAEAVVPKSSVDAVVPKSSIDAVVPKSSIDAVVPKSSAEKVMEGLYKMKVCKYDADKVERELEGELFDKWHESCEVVKATKIAVNMLPAYLDHMKDAYDGIDEQVRKKMDGVLFAGDTWEYKVVEWKFTKGADSGARYGMMAFGRSPDGQFVDCMYVMYIMDFKVSATKIVTQKEESILWGLHSWTTETVSYEERNLGAVTIKKLQNFFRVKAMQGFYQNGVIDKINYVNDLGEIEDEKQ